MADDGAWEGELQSGAEPAGNWPSLVNVTCRRRRSSAVLALSFTNTHTHTRRPSSISGRVTSSV